MSIVDQDQSPFTPAQFEAARFIVARLRAEAADERFEAEQIGLKFTPFGDWPAAIVDNGTMITTTDFIRAALLVVWSLVVDLADGVGTPAEVVQAIGLSLAEHDPA